MAKTTRDQLQLGDFPGLTLLTALEEVCGVKVLHLSFQPTGTAAFVVSESFGAGILLNSENTRWRRNFDLAHELFHLLTWRQFRERGSSDSLDEGGKEEQLADCFASALLIPEEPLRNLMEQFKGARGIPISSVFDVARRFDVSTEALLWRIHNLFRSRGQADQTRRDIERVQNLSTVFEKREPDRPSEKPERFHALAVSALRNGEISIGRFAQLVGASRQQAVKFLEQDGPDDREATLVLT
ncbi:MAG: ImmA/IrrE family metallo-endopeptidase [Acidobacteriota bacterium]